MSLKVFDLQCGNGHIFEGWFSASNSFEHQASQGLLSCPVCGDDAIERKLSAPRLNLGKSDAGALSHPDGSRQHPDAPLERHREGAATSEQLAQLQGALLQQVRKIIKNSEDVGTRFAQEAMKMHHGETKERAIRGTATDDERRELLDEGIAVMPVPDFLNDDQLQ